MKKRYQFLLVAAAVCCMPLFAGYRTKEAADLSHLERASLDKMHKEFTSSSFQAPVDRIYEYKIYQPQSREDLALTDPDIILIDHYLFTSITNFKSTGTRARVIPSTDRGDRALLALPLDVRPDTRYVAAWLQGRPYGRFKSTLGYRAMSALRNYYAKEGACTTCTNNAVTGFLKQDWFVRATGVPSNLPPVPKDW